MAIIKVKGFVTTCDRCGRQHTTIAKYAKITKRHTKEHLRLTGWLIDNQTLCPGCRKIIQQQHA